MSEVKVFENRGATFIARVLEEINDKEFDGWLVKDPMVLQAYPQKHEDGSNKLNINLLPVMYLPVLNTPKDGFRVRYSSKDYQDITDQITPKVISMYQNSEGVKEEKADTADNVEKIFS